MKRKMGRDAHRTWGAKKWPFAKVFVFCLQRYIPALTAGWRYKSSRCPNHSFNRFSKMRQPSLLLSPPSASAFAKRLKKKKATTKTKRIPSSRIPTTSTLFTQKASRNFSTPLHTPKSPCSLTAQVCCPWVF